MFEGYVAGKLANKMFENEVYRIVKRHAFFGALLMMVPDSGLGIIVYVIVLWHMYSKIAKKIGVDFKSNVFQILGVGIVVNIGVALLIDIFMTVLWFLEGFVIYFQFYVSGKLFIESLKRWK